MPTNVLLSMRPMYAAPEQEDGEEEIDDGPPALEEFNDEDEGEDDVEVVEVEEDNQATSFTAEVHANYFTEVLQAYGVELKEWAVCQVSFPN